MTNLFLYENAYKYIYENAFILFIENAFILFIENAFIFKTIAVNRTTMLLPAANDQGGLRPPTPYENAFTKLY
jgi:hypothetical protein